MTGTVTCSTYDSLQEFFLEGHFIVGWDCVMTGGDPATKLLLFSLIFGGLELSLFVTSGSVVLPSVLAILLGGVMFGLLPATLVNLALIGVLLLLGGLGLLIAFRSGT
ncbi:hypothetical protein DQW50_16195 [Halorubrum sp. 48-1-W]|uniref:hypothetical protein n=1 Tax=Halorubrum sp. 48-1-W TaxID=2249761 RepID=UPI000DCB28EA|nr:hypothetical protein [Halorubrum sp. 48-1-W]RAW44065.1 hypothetical protein DQW50_16195 [Halorubrum sp. 48-1-W]